MLANLSNLSLENMATFFFFFFAIGELACYTMKCKWLPVQSESDATMVGMLPSIPIAIHTETACL